MVVFAETSRLGAFANFLDWAVKSTGECSITQLGTLGQPDLEVLEGCVQRRHTRRSTMSLRPAPS
jgi:hypothetical protein